MIDVLSIRLFDYANLLDRVEDNVKALKRQGNIIISIDTAKSKNGYCVALIQYKRNDKWQRN